MANVTRTLADTAGFIPIVWANRALDILRAKLCIAMLIARDTDYEPAPRGKTLVIPYPGTFTAQKKTENNNATVQVPVGGTSKSVTLSEFAYVDFIVEDFARAQASQELLDRYIEPAVDAIANVVERDLLSLYSTFTGGSVGTAGTNLGRSTITGAMKLLNDAKSPTTDRNIILSTKDHAALIGDPNLAQYFAYSANSGITEGKVPNLDGFGLNMNQLVPVVAGSPNVTQNMAFHKNAMILATRPLLTPEDGAGVQATTQTDPLSGLTIRVLKQYDMNARGHRVGFDILYGYAPLRPELGVNLLS